MSIETKIEINVSIKILPFGHLSLEFRGSEIKPEEKQTDKYPIYIDPKRINDYSREYIL